MLNTTGHEMLDIHPTATISAMADIEPSKRDTLIRIGAQSVVDSFVKIKPVGGTGNVVIGERCFINSGCVIYSGNGVVMGNDCLIAANCTFAPVNHAFERRDTTIREQRFLPSKGGIVLEDDVWIGANCVLLDGSYIEKGAVVGAGTTVRGRLSAFGIYGGNPVAKLGERK
jgi:virginiamycin A acetyltransferase